MQEDFIKELELIKERNKRVELDKAWETSWTRRIFISCAIYIISGLWLFLIHDTYPWLKSFVPSVGYLLSTVSLVVIRKKWAEKIKK